MRALPGAAGLIRAASEAGWRAAFASSAPAQHLEHCLRLLDASSLREWATTSDDVEELTGGYGSDELRSAGAVAVYDTPAELIGRLGELERLAGDGQPRSAAGRR